MRLLVDWRGCRAPAGPCAAGRAAPAAALDRDRRQKGHERGLQGAAEGAEHRPVMHRLRRRDRGVGVAHQRRGNRAGLQHQVRLDPEKRRRPQHEIGELADLDRADMLGQPMRQRRVDRVFRDVALDPEIVVDARCPPAARPRWRFILSAVCQVRMTTSPTRPIAWLSDDIMLKAPRSCRMSSAAIVSRRMRLSAKATSSGMRGSR